MLEKAQAIRKVVISQKTLDHKKFIVGSNKKEKVKCEYCKGKVLTPSRKYSIRIITFDFSIITTAKAQPI